MSATEVVLRALQAAVGRAVAALLKTVLAMGALTAAVAIAAYVVAGSTPVRGVLAVLAALGFGAVATSFAAVKRAIGGGLLAAIASARLGERLSASVFERFQAVTQKAESLPLAEAQAKLEAAVRETAAGESPNGWLARRLQATALRFIQWITLARFREEAAQSGGVAVAKVQQSLGARMDQLLVERVEDMVRGATLAAVAIAVLGGMVPALVLRLL